MSLEYWTKSVWVLGQVGWRESKRFFVLISLIESASKHEMSTNERLVPVTDRRWGVGVVFEILKLTLSPNCDISDDLE